MSPSIIDLIYTRNKAINQPIAEATKLNNTFLPNCLSPNLYASDHFTMLLDITAMRIVVPATTIPREPRDASEAIVCVIASTSARPETIQRV
jgi:hypothetical protein